MSGQGDRGLLDAAQVRAAWSPQEAEARRKVAALLTQQFEHALRYAMFLAGLRLEGTVGEKGPLVVDAPGYYVTRRGIEFLRAAFRRAHPNHSGLLDEVAVLVEAEVLPGYEPGVSHVVVAPDALALPVTVCPESAAPHRPAPTPWAADLLRIGEMDE